MSYSPWKQLERRHAKRMKGDRLWRPDYGDSAPDGENAEHIWDCKAYVRHAVITMFLRCEAKYKAFGQGRHFHLCLFAREHSKAGDFIVIRAARHTQLLEAEKRLAELEGTTT